MGRAAGGENVCGKILMQYPYIFTRFYNIRAFPLMHDFFQNNSHREEPPNMVTSPSEPSSNEPDFAAKYNDDQRSESSESSG